MGIKYRFTEQDYREAVKESNSIAEVANKLGIIAAGGNYATIKRKIWKYRIDASHFTGSTHNAGKYITDKPVTNTSMKSRLITKRGHQCERCKRKKWLGELIPLELEHVDGDNTHQVEENCLLLCPNCHALTPTYRRKKSSLLKEKGSLTCHCGGKKKSSSKVCFKCKRTEHISNLQNKITANNTQENIAVDATSVKTLRTRTAKTCIDCPTLIARKSTRCPSCKAKAQIRIQWLPIQEIISKLQVTSYSALARELGVSDSAIRKYVRNNGYDPKTLEPLVAPVPALSAKFADINDIITHDLTNTTHHQENPDTEDNEILLS